MAAATSAALFLSHHAADAFFGPARPPLSFVGGSASGAQSTSTSPSCSTAMSASASASTEEEVQRRHFYGYGDPNHVPSILQNITAQRYIGEETGGGGEVATAVVVASCQEDVCVWWCG